MKCSFNGDFLGDFSNWSCFFDFLCITFQSCAFFFVKRLPKPAGTSPHVWVNYNDLTATSLETMVSKGNHPQMALIQVSEIL